MLENFEKDGVVGFIDEYWRFFYRYCEDKYDIEMDKIFMKLKNNTQ